MSSVMRVSAHARLYRKLRKLGVEEKILKEAVELADSPSVMSAGFQAIRRLAAARGTAGDFVLCTSSITYQRFKQQVLEETLASLQSGEDELPASQQPLTVPWTPACTGGGSTVSLPNTKVLSS